MSVPYDRYHAGINCDLQTAPKRLHHGSPGGPAELAALDLLKAGVDWSQLLLMNAPYHCVTPYFLLAFDPYSSPKDFQVWNFNTSHCLAILPCPLLIR